MITVTAKRKDLNGTEFEPHVTQDTVEKALEKLLDCELGWGGLIKEVSETKIVTETHVLSKIDTTIFEGPASEMLHLIGACKIWSDAKDKTSAEDIVENMDKILGEHSGLPFYLDLCAGRIMGKTIALKVLSNEP